MIRPLQDDVRRVLGEFQRGHPDAGRDLEPADRLAGIEGRGGNTLPQALSDKIGLSQIRIRHHHDELLPAEAAGQIDPADIPFETHGEFAQH